MTARIFNYLWLMIVCPLTLHSYEAIEEDFEPLSLPTKVIFRENMDEKSLPFSTFQTDFSHLFRKLCLGQILITNNTKSPTNLELTGSLNRRIVQTNITLYPGHTILEERMPKLLDIRILGSKNIFLNITLSNPIPEIQVQYDEPIIYPRPVPSLDFKAALQQFFKVSNPSDFVACLVSDSSSSEFEKQFKSLFSYIVCTQCSGEGIIPMTLFEKRENLYVQNNLDKVFFSKRLLTYGEKYRIPHLTHKIWLTSESNPCELPEKYLEWFMNSTAIHPDWQHYLWVIDPEKLPETVKKLASTQIAIKTISKDLPQGLKLNSLFQQAVQENKFGKGSDILRVEILNQLGGFCWDTDYQLHQSLEVFSELYDFMGCLEPVSVLLGNAFMGSRPGHPVIKEYLELIERNHDPKRAPPYIQQNLPSGFHTILTTGPAAFNIAFHKKAGTEGNIDIIMPPIMFFPTHQNIYPNNHIVRPGEVIPLESAGVHYWEGAWVNEGFGSFG